MQTMRCLPCGAQATDSSAPGREGQKWEDSTRTRPVGRGSGGSRVRRGGGGAVRGAERGEGGQVCGTWCEVGGWVVPSGGAGQERVCACLWASGCPCSQLACRSVSCCLCACVCALLRTSARLVHGPPCRRQLEEADLHAPHVYDSTSMVARVCQLQMGGHQLRMNGDGHAT
jgi:hypothetical protein